MGLPPSLSLVFAVLVTEVLDEVQIPMNLGAGLGQPQVSETSNWSFAESP
jgi:hypothetical protein